MAPRSAFCREAYNARPLVEVEGEQIPRQTDRQEARRAKSATRARLAPRRRLQLAQEGWGGPGSEEDEDADEQTR